MVAWFRIGGAVLLLATTLHAAERVWIGPSGGNWTDADVWATGGIPGVAPDNTDTVTITNGAAVYLTSQALTDTNRFASVQLSGNQRGTLVVGPGGYLPTVQVRIAQDGSGPNVPGRFVIDCGSLNVTGTVVIGTDNLNNPGRFEVINGGSFTNSNGSAGQFRVYNGSVLISNATFSTAFTSYLHGSSVTSTFEIVDSTVGMTSLAIGRDVNNANGKVCRNVLRMRSGALTLSGTMEVGHTGLNTANITGVVEQTGGTVTIGGGGMISMPVNSYAVGYYNLNGGRLSLLSGNDAMRLGGRDAASKGHFIMTDGIFTNKGNTVLGTMDRSYARYEQSGGTSFFEKSLQVGAISNCLGELNLLGGTLNLSVANANVLVGNFSNATGRCRVDNGLLNASGRSILLGAAAFANGTLVQSGGIISNSSTIVGSAYFSSGSLIVSNGLYHVAGGVNVGNVSNAVGRCEVDGGVLNLPANALTLGAVSNSVGVFVMNGGAVTNNGFNVANIPTATGTVEITDGQIYTAGEFMIAHGPSAQVRGGNATFTMSGGKLLTLGRWVVGSYGIGYAKLSGGQLEALRNGGTDQSVVIGRDPGSFGRFEMTGGKLKGTNELVIARDTGSTGLVYVAGGDLYFNAVRRSTGVNALYAAGGTLHPYNTNAKFTFNASLTNDIGYGDTGTQFGLSAVDKDGIERSVSVIGTFTGNGGLAKRDAGTVFLGSTLTYTGKTVVEAGTLALSNAVASLASSSIDVQANATLDLSVNRTLPFAIVSGQTLSGSGTVKGPVRVAAGATLSGGSAGAPGTLTVNGDLTLDASTALLVSLSGAACSRIHVTGNLTLPGTASLTVLGAASRDAEGAPLITWDGALSMPAPTRWTVTGEQAPLAVLHADAKSLSLSYRHGTAILVR